MSGIGVDQRQAAKRVERAMPTTADFSDMHEAAGMRRSGEIAQATNSVRFLPRVVSGHRLALPQPRGWLWRRMRGPLVAALTILVATLLRRYQIAIPDTTLIYLLVLVGIAAVDGTSSALVSELIVGIYLGATTLAPQIQFPPPSQPTVQLTVFLAVATMAAVVAGAPRRRTELLRQALRQHRRRLSEAMRSKSEFMDAAAHELRTPLTVISGYASMIQDETFGRLPDRFRDPVAAVQRKARELNALIDEMLLAARVQKGTVPTAAISIDVRDAVREAVERAAPLVTLEQASLSYELPSTPILTEVDPDHLGHILDNLINNALTYSDERPWVKLTVTGGSDARILVKDRGWGVPEDMRHKIFERFVHYANPAYKPKGGRGLGLSVSRELAERYGGSLDLIRSEEGKGSLFVLRLPAVPV